MAIIQKPETIHRKGDYLMILEEPKIYVEEFDPIKIMKNIEKAMRTCYRSEGTITDDLPVAFGHHAQVVNQ